MRLLLVTAFAGACAAILIACVNATDEAEGGGFLFDAAAPINVQPHDAGSGSNWSDLYRDFFGPTGQASCTVNGGDCHGTMNQSGAQAIGFVCGTSKDECYSGLIGSNLVPDGGTPPGARLPAESTVLYQNLRKVPPLMPQGTMPRSSSFAFSSGDLQRIVDWMNAGAKNDNGPAGDSGADAPAPVDASKDSPAPVDAGMDAPKDAAPADAAADAPQDGSAG